MKTTTLALTVSKKNAPKNNIDFDFKPTNTDTITKLVNKINIKKATGGQSKAFERSIKIAAT
jgi:hypothetical protein